MKKHVVLKLTGLAILTMTTLVIISFLEVDVYSYFINPGQESGVSVAHANSSAPYISGISGFIVFFLIARYLMKKKYQDVLKWFFMLPFMYVLADIIIITAAGVKWADSAL